MGEALVYLVFGRLSSGLFLNRYIKIFSGVEDLSAALALNKFCVVLAGDNFDNGVFARGSHEIGGAIDEFSPTPPALSIIISASPAFFSLLFSPYQPAQPALKIPVAHPPLEVLH